MLSLNTLVRLIVLGSLALASSSGWSQAYPTRPIRIVTSEPGGGNDIVARVLAEGLNSSLPQRAIVNNRGIVAVEIAAKAAPDGYTLLLVYGSTMLLAQCSL